MIESSFTVPLFPYHSVATVRELVKPGNLRVKLRPDCQPSCKCGRNDDDSADFEEVILQKPFFGITLGVGTLDLVSTAYMIILFC